MAQSIAQRETHIPGWATWLGFVVLCNAAGFLSSLSAGETSVYAELHQPPFAPPSWVFAPVWTTLYVLMGTAAFLVWRASTGTSRRNAMIAFGVQLGLNALWTPVFFALHAYEAALAVLIAIWVSVIVMMVMFARRAPVTVALLVPLLAWVSFAGVLNGAIVRLN